MHWTLLLPLASAMPHQPCHTAYLAYAADDLTINRNITAVKQYSTTILTPDLLDFQSHPNFYILHCLSYLVMDKYKDLKFGVKVDHSKSKPTDDKLSIKGQRHSSYAFISRFILLLHVHLICANKKIFTYLLQSSMSKHSLHARDYESMQQRHNPDPMH